MMEIFTDNIEFTRKIVPWEVDRWDLINTVENSEQKPHIEKFFNNRSVNSAKIESSKLWKQAIITELASISQYDLLIELCRENISLPDGLLCFAGRGSNFHGFKGRRWISPAGNIYLSVFFSPGKPVEHFGAGFMVLAAVSVINAIDNIPGIKVKAGIKWVNDILINRAKVCGVLSYTQAEGKNVTGAVIGIGINVEKTPDIEPTIFVPHAGSLRDFYTETDNGLLSLVVKELLDALENNYNILLSGGFPELLDFYRKRSLVIGKQIEIYSDDPGTIHEITASGRVTNIGENLELYLENTKKLVKKGRLVIKNQNSA